MGKNINRLRVLRAEKRITQLDAALKAGLSQNRWWRIENGYTAPDPDERERMARALGVDETDAFPDAVAS